MLSTTVIGIIGKHHPEIFELYGNPFGPYGHVTDHAQRVALNPQPLPPAFRSGVAAAFELTELARAQHALQASAHVEVDLYCGNEVRPLIPVPHHGAAGLSRTPGATTTWAWPS